MAVLVFSSVVVAFLLYCLFHFVREGKRRSRHNVSTSYLGQSSTADSKIIVMPGKTRQSRRA